MEMGPGNWGEVGRHCAVDIEGSWEGGPGAGRYGLDLPQVGLTHLEI